MPSGNQPAHEKALMACRGRTRGSPAPVGSTSSLFSHQIDGERPSAVRRERLRHALAETHRRRPVHAPQVDGVARAAGHALLAEQDLAAVGGDVGHPREVHPRELALLGRARRERHDGRPPAAVCQKHAPVRGDVLEFEAARRARHRAHAARQRRGEQRVVGSGGLAASARRAEPDLVAVRASSERRRGPPSRSRASSSSRPGRRRRRPRGCRSPPGARRTPRGRPSATRSRRSASRVPRRAPGRSETRGCRVRPRSARRPATRRLAPSRRIARSRAPRAGRRRRWAARASTGSLPGRSSRTAISPWRDTARRSAFRPSGRDSGLPAASSRSRGGRLPSWRHRRSCGRRARTARTSTEPRRKVSGSKLGAGAVRVDAAGEKAAAAPPARRGRRPPAAASRRRPATGASRRRPGWTGRTALEVEGEVARRLEALLRVLLQAVPTIRSSAGGSGCAAGRRRGGGSSFRIAFIVSTAESPWKARRPVSIS